jgi:AbrB family looped-hinge helix DNA binding protein
MPMSVTSKRQVTIPKPVRDRLALTASDKVTFRLDDPGGRWWSSAPMANRQKAGLRISWEAQDRAHHASGMRGEFPRYKK